MISVKSMIAVTLQKNTCFKNPQNASCIELILTNKPRSFERFMTIENGLPGFHKFSLTVMNVFLKSKSLISSNIAVIAVLIIKHSLAIFQLLFLKYVMKMRF